MNEDKIKELEVELKKTTNEKLKNVINSKIEQLRKIYVKK